MCFICCQVIRKQTIGMELSVGIAPVRWSGAWGWLGRQLSPDSCPLIHDAYGTLSELIRARFPVLSQRHDWPRLSRHLTLCWVRALTIWRWATTLTSRTRELTSPSQTLSILLPILSNQPSLAFLTHLPCPIIVLELYYELGWHKRLDLSRSILPPILHPRCSVTIRQTPETLNSSGSG